MPVPAAEPAIELISTGRIRFPGISSRAWEHPADRAALQSLAAVPGFDAALRKVFGLFPERVIRATVIGSAVEVGPNQLPRVSRIYDEALQILDAPQRYGLFVAQDPVLNAGAMGMDQPIIVLNSGALSMLDDDQLRVVLGHELGHILSEHVLYKTLLRLLMRAGLFAFSLPLTGLALLAVLAALLEWDRKSELSADRAALLVAQDPDHVRAALMRMAGGVGDGASVEAFREQARRFDERDAGLDGVAKMLALLSRSHPFPVSRMKELDLWLESGGYHEILRGTFPRRADDPPSDAWSRWKDSAGQAAENMREAADPAVDWLRGAGEKASDAASGLFNRLWRRGPGDPPSDPPAPDADPRTTG